MEKLKNRPFVVFVLCTIGVLALLFFPSFSPSKILFSNDGPLGAISSAVADQPSGFTGLWFDLNSLGVPGGSYSLASTATLLWILGPLYFAKFYVPLVLAI